MALVASILTACEAAPTHSHEVQDIRTATNTETIEAFKPSVQNSITTMLNSNKIHLVIEGLGLLIICLGLLKTQKNKKLIEELKEKHQQLQQEKENAEKQLEESISTQEEVTPPWLREQDPYRTNNTQQIKQMLEDRVISAEELIKLGENFIKATATPEPPLVLDPPTTAKPTLPKEKPEFTSEIGKHIAKTLEEQPPLAAFQLTHKLLAEEKELTKEELEHIHKKTANNDVIEFQEWIAKNPNTNNATLHSICELALDKYNTKGKVTRSVAIIETCLNHPNWEKQSLDSRNNEEVLCELVLSKLNHYYPELSPKGIIQLIENAKSIDSIVILFLSTPRATKHPEYQRVAKRIADLVHEKETPTHVEFTHCSEQSRTKSYDRHEKSWQKHLEIVSHPNVNDDIAQAYLDKVEQFEQQHIGSRSRREYYNYPAFSYSELLLAALKNPRANNKLLEKHAIMAHSEPNYNASFYMRGEYKPVIDQEVCDIIVLNPTTTPESRDQALKRCSELVRQQALYGN